MAVADRFAEYDDVGNDAVVFERAEVCADAAVACLHFISDTNAAGSSYGFIHRIQLTFGPGHLARDTRHRSRDKSTQSFSYMLQKTPNVFDAVRPNRHLV